MAEKRPTEIIRQPPPLLPESRPSVVEEPSDKIRIRTGKGRGGAGSFKIHTYGSEAELSSPLAEKSSSIAPRIGGLMIGNQKKSFVQDGVRYFPISVAAPIIQAPRTTIVDWIRKGVLFQGMPLQTFYLEAADRTFISEESIERAAFRFVKWPSLEPAGILHLGATADQRGYITLPQAAHEIGIGERTMWLWATQGKAPDGRQPDVIKCPAGDKFYIRQKDLHDLKSFVPKSGLRPGRRGPSNSIPTVR